MNVLKFFNSKSVAKYLQDIGYSFSPQEAASIVWHSSMATWKDKVAAWCEIINTMPDCPVKCRFDFPQYPSLHKFLESYIALVERVGESADENKLSDEDNYLYTAFEYMWFTIPAPFKKGDILYDAKDERKKPFVVDDISFWNSNYQGNDFTDMCAHVYCVELDGEITYDFLCNYIDFEYYDAERLTGYDKALQPLSAYLQGKIDLELFLNAYMMVIERERIKSVKDGLCVDDEGCLLMG